MSTAVRRSPFGVSIDAVAQQWARQDSGEAGAAVVVDREISARLRGGVLWQHPDSTAVAVLARPRAIGIESVDLAWLAASLGAADAIGKLTGRVHGCIWPDRVEVDPDTDLNVGVTVVNELGPGRIEFAILIVRIAPCAVLGPSADVADALVDSLRSAAALLEEPDELVRTYRERCVNLGRRATVSLVPRGSVRGVASDVDHTGALVMTSSTGLAESVAVGMLNQLHPIDSDV